MKAAQGERRGASLYLVILGGVFATIGVLLIFMTVMLVPRMSQLLSTNAVDRTRETVLQSTNSLEIYMDNMLATLYYAEGLLPSHPTPGKLDYTTRLSQLQQSQRDIKNIAFFGEDGSLFYSTAGALDVSEGDVRSRQWFQKAQEWQGTVPYFSAPHVQAIFRGQYVWVVSLAKSVDYFEDGEVHTGVLLIDLDYAAISSLVSGIRLGTSGYIYLMDTQGQLVYHPRQQLIYAGLAAEDTSAVQQQVVGITQDAQDGRDRVLIVNTVNQTRWRMVGVAYIDEILQLQNDFLRILTLVLVCGALLSLGVAAVIAYHIVKPIAQLQRKMQQVEAGDMHTEIDVQGFREIRQLSSAFAHMLQRIRSLMDQIVTEQEAKRLHELNALQAQINPHFLYNTLDSIIWMEERGNSKEAIVMVSALARLFRISISKGRNIILVREEMEHVNNYLIIQKMRFRNKFTYEIDAAENTLERSTVKLIVQPIVENAVHHAIDAYDEQTLHIAIRVWLEEPENMLVIEVEDDGTGIAPEKLQSILTTPSGKSGIGLRNVHERIQLTCGRQYGLTVLSEEDVGTLVTIRLPADLEG